MRIPKSHYERNYPKPLNSRGFTWISHGIAITKSHWTHYYINKLLNLAFLNKGGFTYTLGQSSLHTNYNKKNHELVFVDYTAA